METITACDNNVRDLLPILQPIRRRTVTRETIYSFGRKESGPALLNWNALVLPLPEGSNFQHGVH